MQGQAYVLASNIDTAVDTPAVSVNCGGRYVLVLEAAAYGTTVKLQTQGPNGTWIDINATTYSANQVTAYDLPAGQYRMHITGGTTTDLYATLVKVPY